MGVDYSVGLRWGSDDLRNRRMNLNRGTEMGTKTGNWREIKDKRA